MNRHRSRWPARDPHHPPPARSRRLAATAAAAVAAAALTAGGGLAPAAASAQAPAPAKPAEAARSSAAASGAAASPASQAVALPGLHGSSYTVTLITGDQVKLTAAGTSGRYAITTAPAPRPSGTVPQIQVTGTDGGTPATDIMYAIPTDAQPLITAGLLGRQLFNVGYLATHGDATPGGHLPVTLRYSGHPDAAALARQAARLPGATLTTTHPGTSTVTVGLAARHAAAFWAALTRGTAGAAGQADASLAGGIRAVTSGGSATAPTTYPASEPLYTVTETFTARDNSEDCGEAVETVCTHGGDLVNVDGAGGLISPISQSCVNSDPCSIVQVQWSVPAGTYMSDTQEYFRSGDRTQNVYVDDPQFTVSGDTSIAFNLNDARVLTPSTPQPTEPYNQVTAIYRGYPDYPPGDGYYSITFSSYGDYWWATPTQPVTLGSFHLATDWILGQPMLTMAVTAPEPLTLHPMYPDIAAYVGAVVRFSGRRTLPLAYAGTGTRKDFTGLDVHGKLVMIRIQQGGKYGDTCGVSNSALRNALQAGAAGVLIDPVNPNAVAGECDLPIGYSTTGKHPHIPLVAVPLDEADTLLSLLSRGPVKITVTDSGPARYLYNLKFDQEAQIPATLANTVTSNQLTPVTVSYHASKPETAEDQWAAWASDESVAGQFSYEVAAPVSIREYFGPLSPDIVYQVGDNLGGTIYTVFSRHRSSTIDWGELPSVPGAPAVSTQVTQAQPGSFDLECSGCRQGDTFYPEAEATSSDPQIDGGLTYYAPGSFTLSQDGQEIPPTPVVGGAATSYQLPAQKAAYQLTLDQGSEVTAWGFTSAEPATDHTPPGYYCFGTAYLGSTDPCQADPLIFLRYDAGLDLANAWTAPGSHQLQVTAYHQDPGAPAVTSLTLWTSTNGGASWQKAALTSQGNGAYTTAITVPKLSKTSGTVSIKAQATDAAGNDVTQIIYGAWDLTATG